MPLSVGSRLGPYEILAALGAGGMGEVYLARDARLDRRVALKVLPQRLARHPESLARFEREARAVAALSHPNILALHEFGEHDGTWCAVTEVLEGATLRERVEEGPLPVRKAVDHAVQVARGLGAAHDAGIVHRDLKPENLFVTRDGRVKILDFGLAVQSPTGSSGDASSSPTLGRATDPGVVLGTVGYMAPEQVRGDPADHRGDIFALGCVLYEMLCGRRAFRRETAAETMTAVLRDDPVPLGELQPSVPAALVRIVNRCLEKSPAERFQSARDLAFHLEQWETFSGTAARPPVGRRRRTGPALALLLALLAGAAGGAAVLRWLQGAPRSEAPRVRYLTHSGHDVEPAASPDGRVVVFASRRDGRPRVWVKQLATSEEAAVTEGPDRLPRVSPDGASVLFVRAEDGGESLYLVGTLGGTPRRLARGAAEGDWAPDGRRVAFVRPAARPGDRPALVLTGTDGGEERVLAQAQDARLWCPRWSPDGSRLAVLEGGLVFGTRGVMVLADVATGSARRVPVAERGVPVAVAWASEATLVVARTEAVTGAAGQLFLHDVRSGASRLLLSTPMPVATFDRLPGGRLVLGATSVRQNLAEVRLRDGRREGPERWLTRGSSVDRQPAYAPGGEWVAFSSDRSGDLDVWAVSTRTLAVRRLTHDPADDYDPAFSPDGRALFWSSRRTGHFEVWAGEADGSRPRHLTDDGVDAENPTLAADGRLLHYASLDPRKPGLYRLPAGGGRAERLTQALALVPEVSPDGRHVAYVAPEGALRTLRVVDAATGAPTRFAVPLPSRDVPDITLGRMRWMPGGRALAFVGTDEEGRSGVWVQEFAPGRDTSATRRLLAGFETDRSVESFGVAADGSRLALSFRERQSSLLLVEGLP